MKDFRYRFCHFLPIISLISIIFGFTSCSKTSDNSKRITDSLSKDSLKSANDSIKINILSKHLNALRLSSIKPIQFSIDFDPFLKQPILIEQYEIVDIKKEDNAYLLTLSLYRNDIQYIIDLKTSELNLESLRKIEEDSSTLLLVNFNEIDKMKVALVTDVNQPEGEEPESSISLDIPPVNSIFKISGSLISVHKI